MWILVCVPSLYLDAAHLSASICRPANKLKHKPQSLKQTNKNQKIRPQISNQNQKLKIKRIGTAKLLTSLTWHVRGPPSRPVRPPQRLRPQPQRLQRRRKFLRPQLPPVSMSTTLRKKKKKMRIGTITTGHPIQKVEQWPAVTGRIASIPFRLFGQLKTGGGLSILCDKIPEDRVVVAAANRVSRTASRRTRQHLRRRPKRRATTTTTTAAIRAATGRPATERPDRAALAVLRRLHLISNCSLPDWSRWDGPCAGRVFLGYSAVFVIVRCSPSSPSWSWLPLLDFRYSHDRHHSPTHHPPLYFIFPPFFKNFIK